VRRATFLGGSLDGAGITLDGESLPSALAADGDVYELRSGRYVEISLSESLSAEDEKWWLLRDSFALFASIVAHRRRRSWRPNPLLQMLAAEDGEDS
jgi:hypothetical protein